MEKYEQYKMLYYLSNALQNRCFFKEHLEDIYEWHDDYGKNIVDYTWTPIAETKRFTDFKDIVRTQKAKAYKRGEEFVQELEKKIKSLKNSSLSIMEKRIRFVSELLGLSECEQELYGLLSRIKLDDNFEDFNRDVCGRNNKLKYNASFLLATKQHKIEKLLEKDASLIRLGLVENDYGDVCASDLTLKILSQHIENVTDIKNIILGNPCKANLQWNDFSYLKEKDFCARILQKSVKNKEKGINLLFYGEPGTGKTEFAKILAEKIKAELYAVGEKFEDRDRKENLNLAYSILSKDNCACLLIDEADDFLGQEYFGFIKKKDDNKLYINRLLENNQTPTIWIINSIENIDKAYLRRFTYALNFSKPNLKIRTEMWQKSLKAHNLPSDKKTAEEFAVQYKLSPSFITSAVRTAQLANGGLAEVKQSLNALEKAYNNGRCIAPKRNASTKFNPKLLNTDTDLTLLSERIKQLPQRNFSLCLYGASGTGKTTCFYCVTGLITPDYGDVHIDGKDITHLPMYRRARMGIGYLPQEASIFRSLTVEDNIKAILQIVIDSESQRENMLEELLSEFSIAHLRKSPAIALSGGERRRLEIARALASQPNFILLDEPLAGIDPIAVSEIRNLVSQLKHRGLGVLITDHNVRETLDITDRAYILHGGTVLMEGTPDEIIANKEVRKVYLGDNFSM